VDNIELTSPDAQTTLEALENFTKFTELLDLEVDAEKTFVWATESTERRWFCQHDQKVKMWARDLGGHVQHSLQREHRPKSNCLIEKPLADPGFFALWSTVMDFGTHASFDASVVVMEKIANDISGRVRPTTGPCSGLLSRLHQINWSWRDSTIKDHWGQAIDVDIAWPRNNEHWAKCPQG